MNYLAVDSGVARFRSKTRPVYPWSRIKSTFDNFNNGPLVQFNFYRHGETLSNAQGLISGQEDSPLSKNGIEEARMLRNVIPKNYNDVFCSGLTRSQQTMKTAIGKDIIFYIDERLNEFNFGLLTSKKRHFIKEFADGDIDYRPPEGESYRDFAQRVFSFLIDEIEDCASSQLDKKIDLVFAHAGVLRVTGSIKAGVNTTAKDMFLSKYKNLEVLVVNSDNIILPQFWVL